MEKSDQTGPHTALQWIEMLGLKAHPEGGFFRETYRSAEMIPQSGLPARFPGARAFATGIYFLLRSQDRSVFHRIKSDEMWHFYDGATLSIFVLDDSGVEAFRLGKNISAGESPQILIPAGKWFGAAVEDRDSFVLAGCTVAPGFDFQDFEMADRFTMLKTFPAHSDIIERLT